jgi:predicted secreted Zn-dependent protease
LFYNGYIKLAIAGVIILATAGACLLPGKNAMTVEAVTSTTAAAAVSTPTNPNNPASSAGSATQGASSAQSSSAPNCQSASYNQPDTPAANTAQPGLHQNILAPSYYIVYGNTVKEINSQMARCTPAGTDNDRYAASTNYALNWAFDYVAGVDGICHVTAATVSINIGVVYPSWQPTSGAAAGTNASWQKFITSLATHENGHVSTNQAGAAQLLADLQNFPASDCNMIVAQVTAKATADIQAINQANDSYDAATNHGLTQGAVLN